MEPSTSFSIATFLKNVTTLFKFIELSNKGVNAEKNIVSQYKNEQQFDQFFNQLNFDFDQKKIYSAFQFDEDDIQLAIRLPYALAFRYLLDEEFNSIRMQADHQNQYGELSMDEYFITPSYIPEEDLRKRETLMQAEKETSNTKIEKMKAKFFQNFLPHEYISGSLFNGIDRVVITGNPGVGKSTYSRWLCYNWAKQQLNINGILLHINLRLLQFGKDNSLVQYISQTYLKGADTKRLQKILSTINQDFYFVLDGFDELDDAGQKALKNDLYQLGSNVKFILLSRPYGLLNSQGLNWDFSFQIDGFTNSNIYNYIDKFLLLNNRQKMRDKLLDIISQNRVLEDYAHNPLMLSYITYLFLEEDKPEKRLAKVQSQYDLQDLVFSWIRNHEKIKKSKEELDKWMTEAAEFAYQMEINKKLVLANTETLDDTFYIVEYLNSIGLGKMQAFKQQRYWQFSFNTLTFQEFLAARHLVELITPEAFLYLCKEKYFWNFTRMLIGCLSLQGKEDKIEAILQGHLDIFHKTRQTFHLYFYVMHLSETSSEFLQQKFQADEIVDIYNFYRIAFWDNTTWRPIFLDAIARIYSKLSLPNKTKLQDLIYNEFVKMLSPSPQPHGKPTNVEHAKALIIKLRLEDDLAFLRKILALQELTMANLMQPAYPSYLDEAHEGLMFLFDEVLCKASPKKLMVYPNDLKRLLINTIDLFILPKAKLQLHFTILKGLPKIVYADCIALEQFIHQFKNDKNKMELEGQAKMQALAIRVYHLGNLAKDSDTKTKNNILPILKRCTKILLEGINYAAMKDYDQDELGQLLIDGLVKINMPELYDSIMQAAINIQPSYMVLRIPNNDAFFSYLQTLIDSNEIELNEVALDKLIMSLNIVENARNQFARIREKFSDILTGYVQENNTAFEESNGGYVQAQAGTPAANHYEITQKFNSIIESALTDSKVFAYDKKYLIDKFTAFHHYRYFKRHFHPSIWGREFDLYQDDYWKLVLKYTEDIENLPALITILRNHKIYHHISNISPLSEILQYFLLLLVNEVPSNFSLRLMEILSRCLVLLKVSEENAISIDKDQFLQTIIALTEKYDLKNAFLNIDIHQIEGKDLMLFILLFYFTKNEQYDLIKDYDVWLENYPAEKKDFMNALLHIFTEKEKLNLEKLQSIHPILGKDLVERLNSLLEFHTELVDEFDVKQFEQQLNGL